MPEIVTDFKPFENSKKPLKTIAHCDFAPRFLPTKIREEPRITRDADFESGDAYAFAWIGTKEKNVPVDGKIASVVDDEGLRNFGVNEPEGYWLEKGSSGSPVILKNVPKLAGLVSIADVEGDQKEVRLREAFIVPGTTIWRFVSAAQARPVAERENVDVGKLRELLANLGHDNVPANEIPARLDESLKALRERGEKQAAPSNAGADIDATIAAARAKLRESDPQAALALLKAKRAEETQARTKRETALLAEQAAVERLAYDYAGAKETLKELTQLDPDAVWRWIDLGDLWRTTGNLAEAERAFRGALDATRRQGFARDESAALNRFGAVLVARGRLAEALQSFRDSLAIVGRLAKANPNNTQWQYDLGVSNGRIGAALVAQGDLAGAMKYYRARHEIISRLAQGDPDNAQWQFDLGVSNECVGDVLLAQGDLARAMKSYRARHEIITHLAKTDPDNAEWQRDLSVSFNKMGLLDF
jgi:tetratricopeptide (TPR) repeat protein